MNFYEGTVSTVILSIAFILATIFITIYFILIRRSRRDPSVLLRFGITSVCFGCAYFGMCKLTEILDLTDLQATLCMVLIFASEKVISFFIRRKDKRR